MTTIQTQLSLYLYPTFMILGDIGNVSIIIIFSGQRQTACSIYLICSAVANIVFLTITGFVQVFPINYADGTIRAIISCKVYIFIVSSIGQVAKTMVILSCIDRFLITSDRASFRAFSTSKRAKYLIFYSFIFWLLVGIHNPIMRAIVNGQCIASGVYSTIYVTLFISLIPSLISVIFGYLTYRNMRQIQMRVQPVVQNTINANIPLQRRDRDLLIIVISEVLVYVVTTALHPFIVLEMTISPYVIPNKSSQYIQTEIIIFSISNFLLFINSAAPFYTYYISSKSFRRDFKQLVIKTFLKLTRQTPVQMVSRTN